ncbi:MAG: 1,4-dihydroxy-2-naphthoate octaprenyltransferase [Tannerella sp.]|jgi:1,4-dihydroxy-2-naphthoate octaprenyltransferase|nr:1,4-dihydroxy-2-naphthoate octaprenyltransferase [Tannerella sp.]
MATDRLKAWILATRPKTLAASVSPVIVASALAFRDRTFRLVPALLCLGVALLAQIAANLANDYFDFKKGADSETRLGQARAVASGWIKPRTMLIAALATLAAACICGCGLLFFGSWQLLLPVGIAVAICVIAYSAGPYPLAYNGLGDVCVLLFYGIVPVCFTYYVQAQTFTATAVWLSLSMGFMSVNILLVNNYRDCDQDRAAGKRTTIVMFGRRFGRWLYLADALLAVACSWTVYLFRSWNTWILFLFFLIIQLFIWQDLSRLQGAALNRTLELTSLNVLLYALLLTSVMLF